MTNRLLSAARGAAHASAQGCPSPACTGVDLHLHSTYSDGLFTPEELCQKARKAGVGTLALTDHDTADGMKDMKVAAEAHGLRLFPGVEVSTGEDGRVHVLCYGENVCREPMTSWLRERAGERTGRAKEMIRLLDGLGIVISEEERARLLAIPTVGRAHIARSLVAMGVVSTVKQAFDRYLAEGKPAYVPRPLLPTAHAVETLRRMKVVTVLAHPVRMNLEWTALQALVNHLRECGLQGLEAFHSSANARTARQLDGLARQCGLLVTGGSDFHGDVGSTLHIGRLPAGWQQWEDDLSALLHLTLYEPR